MSDIHIRIEGRAGRITLQRPKALNAVTYAMCTAIETALDRWRHDDAVALVILDAEGDKAFSAGGDIADLYATGMAGNFGYGQEFWRDEYRLNAKIHEYQKPIVSLLQGFTMGGGMGVGCHGSHRVVGETSQIAMPECGIGLVPDVGGSMILANAPGHLGAYAATTGARMNAGDAILMGFADLFIPQDRWPGLIAQLVEAGDPDVLRPASTTPPEGAIRRDQQTIDRHFGAATLPDLLASLRTDTGDFAKKTLKALLRSSPLSVAVTLEMMRQLRGVTNIYQALELEYRFTFRAMEHGDFLEGIRAAIIDKDRNPSWRHSADDLPQAVIDAMLAPLGDDRLDFKEKTMKIGFIGLGNMGALMAHNLANEGHEVSGFDMAEFEVDGVTIVGSAAQAATDADVVITMLPNGAILRSVAAEIIPAMSKGAAFVDCSTVDVESARAVASDAVAAGLLPVDAPVSGGIGGAAGGTLTFMAGGSAEAFAKAAPLFDIMGQKAVHCGDSGAGQAAKICNNMILGITMIGTCEAFALADKLGLDRQKMFEVVSTSSGYSWTMNAYCPAPGVGPESPADNGYQPGFAADLMLKDLRLSQQAAESVDADTPMGKSATALYAQFVEDEDGQGKDFSAMLPRFENRGRD